MESLILFCGGPAIYPGGVPKPLQDVAEGRTLLELYLGTPLAEGFTSVTLLCESDFLPAFRAVAERAAGEAEIRIVETPNRSGTLQKLRVYLGSGPVGPDPVTFSYPDIFYFGHISPLVQDPDWSHQVSLSLRAMSSRFPRIAKEPYTPMVRSISDYHASVPANPVYLFGGHLLAAPEVLDRVLAEGVAQNGRDFANLEFDAFAWMISLGIAQSVLLDGVWMKADGQRDLEELRRELAAYRKG